MQRSRVRIPSAPLQKTSRNPLVCQRFQARALSLRGCYPPLAATSRNRRSDLSFELHRVEVTPTPLRGRIGSRTGLIALRTGERPTGVGELDDDLVLIHVEVDVFDVPGVIQPEQGTVVFVEFVHFPKKAKLRRFCDQPLNSGKIPLFWTATYYHGCVPRVPRGASVGCSIAPVRLSIKMPAFSRCGRDLIGGATKKCWPRSSR